MASFYRWSLIIFAMVIVIEAAALVRPASAQTPCSGTPAAGDLSPTSMPTLRGGDGISCASSSLSGVNFTSLGSFAFPAAFHFLAAFPDADASGVTGGTNGTRIIFLPSGGATRSQVTVTCPGATVLGSGTTLPEILLSDGGSCSLTATGLNNGGPGVSHVYSGAILSRTGNAYSVTSGSLSGGNFGGSPGSKALSLSKVVDTVALALGTPISPIAPIMASGGKGSLNYAISPALPSGLAFNAATGQLSGTPTAPLPTTAFTVTVSDQTTPIPQVQSASFSLSVTQGSTSISLVSAQNPSLRGQLVKFTVLVSPPPSTGTVTIASQDGVLCDALPVSNSTASCSATFSAAGVYAITAVYIGEGALRTSTLTQFVNDQTARTAQAIGGFLAQRNNQVLTNGASEGRQIDRLATAAAQESNSNVPPQNNSNPPQFSSASASETAISSRPFSPHDARDHRRFAFAGNREQKGANADYQSDSGPIGSSTGGPSGLGLNSDYTTMSRASGTVDALRQLGGELGGIRMGASAEGATRLEFATSMSGLLRSSASGTPTSTHRSTGIVNGTHEGRADGFNRFDFWVDAKYSKVNETHLENGQTGHFGALLIGADYILSPTILVGTLIQFDSMRQRSVAGLTDVKGEGWIAGPYATLRLTQNLFWQVRAGWGRSSNEIAPYLSYTDRFDSTRWLVASNLVGRWNSGPWSMQPSLSLAYMEDTSSAYVDSFGVTIPSVTSHLGQVKAGPEISYRYKWSSDLTIVPHLGAQLIWNFSGTSVAGNAISLASEASGPNGARGRLELGLRAISSSGIGLDISAGYDGIGSTDYHAVTGKVAVHIPLH